MTTLAQQSQPIGDALSGLYAPFSMASGNVAAIVSKQAVEDAQAARLAFPDLVERLTARLEWAREQIGQAYMEGFYHGYPGLPDEHCQKEAEAGFNKSSARLDMEECGLESEGV